MKKSKSKLERFKEYYTEEELEKFCKRCGKCCHEKTIINGRVHIFLNNKCKYLKKDKVYYCSVYETRHKSRQSAPNCFTLEEAIEKNLLPNDCGYKEFFPEGYKAVVEVENLRDIRW